MKKFKLKSLVIASMIATFGLGFVSANAVTAGTNTNSANALNSQYQNMLLLYDKDGVRSGKIDGRIYVDLHFSDPDFRYDNALGAFGAADGDPVGGFVFDGDGFAASDAGDVSESSFVESKPKNDVIDPRSFLVEGANKPPKDGILPPKDGGE